MIFARLPDEPKPHSGVAPGPAATALEDSAELLRTMLESERDGQGGPAENGHAGPKPSGGSSPAPGAPYGDATPAARQQGLRDRYSFS